MHVDTAQAFLLLSDLPLEARGKSTGRWVPEGRGQEWWGGPEVSPPSWSHPLLLWAPALAGSRGDGEGGTVVLC